MTELLQDMAATKENPDFITIGLWGKKYVDVTVHLPKINLGETNNKAQIENKVGGMYNIPNANIDKIMPVLFPEELIEFLHLNEYKENRATHFPNTQNERPDWLDDFIKERIVEKNLDWIHIMYVDDFTRPERLLKTHTPIHMSISFCGEGNRKQYIKQINKSKFVFDSRKRKNLYNKIKTNTPIILHDEFGCECIIDGEMVYQSKTKSIKKLNSLEGAGDIFCALFIREYTNSGLEGAIQKTSKLTTQKLREIK